MTMNNKDTVKAPERIWVTWDDAYAWTTPDAGDIEYQRVDPPAAPTDEPSHCNKAPNCSFNYENPSRRWCDCKCKGCTPPAPDEADKALAQEIVGRWGYEEPYWWEPIAAALAQARKEGAQARRPIETAPKDRTILLEAEGLEGWLQMAGYWAETDWYFIGGGWMGVHPTHWTPLPDPPTSKQER